MDKTAFKNIDEYIAACPPDVRERLSALRALVRRVVPTADEKISYNMPAFAYHGSLVYFAAAKAHIGLYGATDSILAALPEAAAYKTSKGTLQFPHNHPLPLDLIEQIVRLRAKENEAKA